MKDLVKNYPKVFHMFLNFMRIKYKLPKIKGGVKVSGLDIHAKRLVLSFQNDYIPLKINLALLDVREIPKTTGTDATADLDTLLKFLSEKLEPKLDKLSVWLFILQTRANVKATIKFEVVKMKDYDFVQLSYVPKKAEMLDNYTKRNIAEDVPILFLEKKDNEFVKIVHKLMKKEY